MEGKKHIVERKKAKPFLAFISRISKTVENNLEENRRKEIITVRLEIKEIENKERISKSNSGFYEKTKDEVGSRVQVQRPGKLQE